ncbi:type II toxin-antitoxin system Phd/YefM family antitoxin [Cellulomonas soli]|uniref:type II toxin-antitoxin system Phd/YefM family antitoxin n=1 Tax=Cellulomonas soli TaxID=931535 RepID=UPI0011BF0820|nr:type II toxin-antitoxin system prevent-host-death family antitoxin [Cellulomonas soli]NYI59257.1 prevent-host-death family protein [Cellulomonas soli]
MEVAVSALRAELKQWIEAAKAGEDVVITDRGVPVARLSGIESADLLTRLTRDGLLTAPDEPRPPAEPEQHGAQGAHGPGARQPNAVSGLVRRLRR